MIFYVILYCAVVCCIYCVVCVVLYYVASVVLRCVMLRFVVL